MNEFKWMSKHKQRINVKTQTIREWMNCENTNNEGMNECQNTNNEWMNEWMLKHKTRMNIKE